MEPPAKKKARRPTGTLRKWTADEEDLLRELVATLDPQQKARRADFDGFAEKLNAWAQSNNIPGGERSGYAVEQRWQLYLKPDAVRAASAAQVAPPSNLTVGTESEKSEKSEARSAAKDTTPAAAAAAAGPSSTAAGTRKAVSSPQTTASAAASAPSSSKASGKRKAGAASPGAPTDDQQPLWDPSMAATLLIRDDFEELAMDVAEKISLQAMSRMCRKGMGFRATDDPRLRRAEHSIDPEREMARIERAALAPIEAAAAPRRPASLRAVHNALAAAWHAWRETDLTTAHRDYEPSGCLGEPWHHEYEAPTTFGFTQRFAALWVRTLTELWDAGHTAPPPPTAVRQLVAMDAFMRRIQALDKARYAEAQAFFQQAAAQAETARKAEAAAKRAAEEKVRREYVAQAAKERKQAHRAYLQGYKAKPLRERRAMLFVTPGDGENNGGICWQCCGTVGHLERSVTLGKGEEATPLSTAALPSGLTEDMDLPYEGDFVSFCIECYDERCEALGIEPSEYSDEDDW